MPTWLDEIRQLCQESPATEAPAASEMQQEASASLQDSLALLWHCFGTSFALGSSRCGGPKGAAGAESVRNSGEARARVTGCCHRSDCSGHVRSRLPRRSRLPQWPRCPRSGRQKEVPKLLGPWEQIHAKSWAGEPQDADSSGPSSRESIFWNVHASLLCSEVRVSKFQQAQQARLFGTKQPEKAGRAPFLFAKLTTPSRIVRCNLLRRLRTNSRPKIRVESKRGSGL